MYALSIIRYRRPLEEVVVHQEAHRAYLRGLKEQGILLASGPLDPRYGGALLLRVPDDGSDAALDRIRENDPYVKGGVAQHEVLRWAVSMGRDDLDRLG
jgi:uncharacterized protein YciI